MHPVILREAPVLGVVALGGVAVVWGWPELLGVAMGGLALVAVLVGCLLWPGLALGVWVLAVGLTPDMWLDPDAGMAVVAALKVAGLGIVLVCALRFGTRWDGFNPGLAFFGMFGWSIFHGLHPLLDWPDSARSLLGSAAPFAFGFVKLPDNCVRAIIRAVLWVPLASVLVGLGLALMGWHAVLVEGGGLRLQGAGHPAFLAGFAMVAIYAALLEFLRSGRARYGALLGLNLLILALTGARAPLAIALSVVVVALLAAPSAVLGWAVRAPLLLGGALFAVLVPLAADALTSMRIFNLLAQDAGNLSGRDEIWPIFQQAWDQSPWFGWGVGAAKNLVALDSPTALLLGTNAAHNEYLRIGVEGGYLGLGLLILCFVLWARAHLRVPRGPDRLVLLLVLIGFAVHSTTDNTLIATTSSVLFAWIFACFARAKFENAPS